MAPAAWHIAAKLSQAFPGASANLIRALMVSPASVPARARDVLSGLAENAVLQVCGYGAPELGIGHNFPTKTV